MTFPPVTVVDLGLGNLYSVMQALRRAGGAPVRSADPEVVRRAERVVVPGQGAFGDCARALESGLGEALLEVLRADRPYLGICLGMQLLFEGSDEAPQATGLGWLRGRVRRFPAGRVGAAGRLLKVPHMGWAPVRSRHRFVDDGGWYYFVHSYHCQPSGEVTVGSAEYGQEFCAAVSRGALFACQFHPEKSHRRGARLIERFLRS